MTQLAQKRCKACEGDTPPLDDSQVRELLSQLNSGWTRAGEGTKIRRTFKFRNYYQATAFINAVAWIAHQEDHHPDICFGYNQAEVVYTTHAVSGLSENDFICAAKVDNLFVNPE